MLAAHTAGLIALTGCRRGPVAAALLRGDETATRAAFHRLLDLFGGRQLFVEVQHHDLPDDDRLVRRLLRLVHGTGVPVVATHNAHYATRERSMARDVLIATRHNMTLLAARRAGHLPLNSNYALPAPAAMARRFAERPDAIAATLAIAERCQVSLDFSAQRLPVFTLEEDILTQRRRGAEKDGRGGEREQGKEGERGRAGRQSPNLQISNLQSRPFHTSTNSATPTCPSAIPTCGRRCSSNWRTSWS